MRFAAGFGKLQKAGKRPNLGSTSPMNPHPAQQFFGVVCRLSDSPVCGMPVKELRREMAVRDGTVFPSRILPEPSTSERPHELQVQGHTGEDG